jgi:zinc transporter 13
MFPESRTSWVVPFTAGGFLHIALVTVVPELLAERDRWESAKQVAGLLTGMCVMTVLTAFFD